MQFNVRGGAGSQHCRHNETCHWSDITEVLGRGTTVAYFSTGCMCVQATSLAGSPYMREGGKDVMQFGLIRAIKPVPDKKNVIETDP